jgi:hypothetical protein
MSQPSQLVFFFRRIFLLGILALIIWGLVALVGFVGGLFNQQPAATITEGQECAPGTVSVNSVIGDGTTEQLSFDAGVNPYLWFTLTNTGTVSCKFNGGPRVTFFTIKSGDEQIWSSRDCDRTGLVDKWVTLKPNTTFVWKANDWRRVHSSSTGCGDGQDPALPGAYALTAEVNGVISGNYEQFLIN